MNRVLRRSPQDGGKFQQNAANQHLQNGFEGNFAPTGDAIQNPVGNADLGQNPSDLAAALGEPDGSLLIRAPGRTRRCKHPQPLIVFSRLIDLIY